MHELHLQEKPFQSIKRGTKTIEMRLFDEKRSKIKENDLIEFTNTITGEKVLTMVKKIHHYLSFEELYEHFSKESLGYDTDEPADYHDMEKYYSREEQAKYGVVGLEIEVIKSAEIVKNMECATNK